MFSKLRYWTEFSDKCPDFIGDIARKLYNAEMWVKYRVQRKHMYQHVFTDLKPGYYDIDHVMEAALVALLRRYVDEEMYHMQYGDDIKATGWEALQDRIGWLTDSVDNPVEGREWESDMTKPQLNAEKEIAALYQWFCIDKPALQKEHADLVREWFTKRGNLPFFKPKETELGLLYEFTDEDDTVELKNGREKMDALEKHIDSTTDDMLVRLVKVRGTMWT